MTDRASTATRRRVTEVTAQSFAEFAGKSYVPYQGMPIFTTVYETSIHPQIGETATSFYERVRTHPSTTILVDRQPGTFAHGEERARKST